MRLFYSFLSSEFMYKEHLNGIFETDLAFVARYQIATTFVGSDDGIPMRPIVAAIGKRGGENAVGAFDSGVPWLAVRFEVLLAVLVERQSRKLKEKVKNDASDEGREPTRSCESGSL